MYIRKIGFCKLPAKYLVNIASLYNIDEKLMVLSISAVYRRKIRTENITIYLPLLGD